MSTLIIVADDYGYAPSYDAGILEAVAARAIDAVSAFATRPSIEPDPLLAGGVEIGLHLDLGTPARRPRASQGDREGAAAELRRQFERFGELFGRPPAYLDGHHHCHARDGLGAVVADFAIAAGLPVRSISPRHRRLLRCRGVRTPDLLVGRMKETEAVLPPELDAEAAEGLPDVVEWVVHPGYRAERPVSSYDAGREEDLRLLLDWRPPSAVIRATHAEAL